jgi:hypothetical protein
MSSKRGLSSSTSIDNLAQDIGDALPPASTNPTAVKRQRQSHPPPATITSRQQPQTTKPVEKQQQHEQHQQQLNHEQQQLAKTKVQPLAQQSTTSVPVVSIKHNK